MNTELRTRIRNKVDDLSNWLSSDPILLNGEIVVVNDISANNQIRIKVGDGSSTFSELPYVTHQTIVRNWDSYGN